MKDFKNTGAQWEWEFYTAQHQRASVALVRLGNEIDGASLRFTGFWINIKNKCEEKYPSLKQQ